MSQIVQLIAVIDNQNGTFTTQVIVCNQLGVSTAPVIHPVEQPLKRQLTEEELAAALKIMTGQDIPVGPPPPKAVDFKAGCVKCEAKEYHTEH